MLRMKEGEDTPLYGYIGVSRPKEYGFLAVLVRNRVLILAILGSNRVWFLHPSLDLGLFFRRSYFFIIIDKTVDKNPLQGE